MTSCHRVALVAGLALSIAGPAAAAIDRTTGREATPSITRGLPPAQAGGVDVLWDLSHGVYLDYEPTGRYSTLVSALTVNGFTVWTTLAGIENSNLPAYGILVICLASANDTPYTPSEVAAIQSFIASGKGVLVMADNLGTPNSNINPVTVPYGTTCGVAPMAISVTFSTFISHPIFTGVNSIYYVAPGELAGVAPSVEAAFTGEGQATVTVHQACGLAVTGDVNFADNDFINTADNWTFALNLFRWRMGSCPTPTGRSTWGELKVSYR